MSLALSKTNTPTYDYYSTGDGTDPVSTSALLTNVGGTINSGTVTAYLVATEFRYTSITVGVTGEDTGIDWKLSLNNVDWANSVTPADMNALSADAVTTVYIRFVATNDGTVPTGLYDAPDITIAATEEPV